MKENTSLPEWLFENDDDLFGKLMDAEDTRHLEDISADIVPLQDAKPYENVQFGNMVWQVIGVENEKKLLLSKECVGLDFDWEFGENSPAEETENACCWENSNVRKYLNDWFVKKNFSEEESAQIVPYDIQIGNKCLRDRVILLNREEIEKYIPENEDRIASMHVMFHNVVRAWLVRLDVDSAKQYCIVNDAGEIEEIPEGYLVEWFRPAVWVKIR